MKIREPLVITIAYKTWCIDEYGMDAFFLLEGEEKALLIDTGLGTVNIKKCIENLTDKPLVVALTHGHLDHAGGIDQFSEIYISEKDIHRAKSITDEDRVGYIDTMSKISGDLYAVNDKSIYHGNNDTQFIPISEGDVFDLGNRLVKVIETPGHTSGSISFLDVKERIIFTGDACNRGMLLATEEGSTISSFMETAVKLKNLESEYDRNYNGHIGYGPFLGGLNCQDASINENMINCCKAILDGSITGYKAPRSFLGNDALCADYKELNITYFESQVR